MLAHNREAVFCIEGNGSWVLLPHAEPRYVGTTYDCDVKKRSHEGLGHSLSVPGSVDVETLNLGRSSRDNAGGSASPAKLSVTNQAVADVAHESLAIGIENLCALNAFTVSVAAMRVDVLRAIHMSEGVAKRTLSEFGKRGCISLFGWTDVGQSRMVLRRLAHGHPPHCRYS